MTDGSVEEYKKTGQTLKSPLFDFTMKNFNVKRKEFCYAGDWTYVLNLKTGILKRCYASAIYQNIFKNPDKPIRQLAVGNKCESLFCLNSSHFMSLGVIPEVDTPTYAALRDRSEANWYSDKMNGFLSQKLNMTNKEYSRPKKILSNIVGNADKFLYRAWIRFRKYR